MGSSIKIHHRACNLCEAICGLEITVENERITSIKGDKNDPLSKGHICPKAVALQDIYNDPDRLKQPVKKTKDGWQQISWEQAFDEVISAIKSTQKNYGNDAVAIYQGNPTVHNMEAMLYGPSFYRSLRTSNHYSATSVDQLPEQLVSLKMFGHSLMIPLADLDRTDFIIIIGANPVVSNGSMMTAPGVKKRLKSIQQRGGKVVVIDPRKTETAKMADQHLFITPGTDALLLLAMLQVVYDEKLGTLGSVADFVKNFEDIESLVKQYTPESVEKITGIEASHIRQLVRDFCGTPKATCYGRIGVSTHEFGTLTQWLIVVFNIITGKLDIEGGMMFSKPAIDVMKKRSAKSKGFADKHTRVSGLPNFSGEFPVAALAEEIMTEGSGQIKTLITHAGNPILSTPNGRQLESAFKSLDFMASIDFYINETTHLANIILPPLSILERPHYDLVFHSLAIQNTTTFSEPVFKAPKNTRSTADIYLELIWRFNTKDSYSKLMGWIKKIVVQKLGSEWIINRMLKRGFYGKSHGLTINKLKNNPSGIDLGALKPSLPKRLFTEDKKIDLAPEIFIEDMKRLENFISRTESQKNSAFDFLLIGRRDPRTNNSWLHNSHRMVKGKNRCTVLIHPEDAEKISITDGDEVVVQSRVGKLNIIASITDEMMPGVISIPHGWGHENPNIELSIAKDHVGVNVNLLTDEKFIDQCSGNAALNGVPVAVTAFKKSPNKKKNKTIDTMQKDLFE